MSSIFNVSIPDVIAREGRTLVLSGCRLNLTKDTPYSEFEELNYYSLNCNDFCCGRADIELSFENKFQNPYFKFYIQCITIRTESELLCKINKNPEYDASKDDNYSKVTKDGKLALGLGYNFKTQKERELLANCKIFCIEGFLALKKKTNVYGFMCQIEKTEGGWQMREGNTYKIYKLTIIK